jgi:hypothetical protein
MTANPAISNDLLENAMHKHSLTTLAFTTLGLACALNAAAQTAATTPKLPRTSWGDPRIEGTYTNKDENGTPFERPDDLASKQRREFGPEQMQELMVERTRRAQAGAVRIGGSADNDTGAGPPHWYEHLDAINSRPWFVSEPADGKVPPVTDAARQRAQARGLPKREAPDTYTDMSLYDRCITIGLPGSMMPMIYGNAYRITQSPGYVAIQYEMIHEARIIPLGDAPRLASNLDFYMGEARGHFEGDTLVVETRNVRPQAAYRNASENLVITERFAPIDENALSWEVRFEDPDTWTAPWAFEMPLKRDAEAQPFEYACHEGNLGLANILSAARATDNERESD